MITIHPTAVTCWQFPDDAAAGKQAFLNVLANPQETWILAYAFTMGELAGEVVAAHKAGVPVHVFVDHSESITPIQKAILQPMVAAGCEVTIGTSYAGSRYIAHEKGMATVGGSCWEGSTNFSASAWSQINTAMQFDSPEYRDRFVGTFNRAVEYAWANEQSYQMMERKPALAAG